MQSSRGKLGRGRSLSDVDAQEVSAFVIGYLLREYGVVQDTVHHKCVFSLPFQMPLSILLVARCASEHHASWTCVGMCLLQGVSRECDCDCCPRSCLVVVPCWPPRVIAWVAVLRTLPVHRQWARPARFKEGVAKWLGRQLENLQRIPVVEWALENGVSPPHGLPPGAAVPAKKNWSN